MNPSIRLKLILMMALGLHFSSFSQEVFELKDSIIVLSKTLDFENVHWYGEIINLRDSITEDLQWKLETPIGVPASWECNFDDQTQNSENVMHGDSAQFLLKANEAFLQKLIIGVQHNGSVGNAQYAFKISTLAEPEKIKTQLFRIRFEEGTNSSEELDNVSAVPLKYSDGWIHIIEPIENLSICNAAGRLLFQHTDPVKDSQYDLRSAPSGIYFVSWNNKGKRQVRKFYF